MKLYEIIFTSFKDTASAKRSTKASNELAPVLARKGTLEAARAKLAADTPAEDFKRVQDELDATTKQVADLTAAEERAAEVAAEAARQHPKVGTRGYQLVDDRKGEVVAILDAAGEVIPASAVYEYELVDLVPDSPEWPQERFDALARQFFPAEQAAEADQVKGG